MRLILFLILLAACDVTEPYAVSDIYWVDGDSGTIDGERFRLAEVDAPEIRDAMCESERALGEEARRYVRGLTVRSDLQVTADYGLDRYDRRVIELSIDGEAVIDLMIARGYLQSWVHLNGRALQDKPDWC